MDRPVYVELDVPTGLRVGLYQRAGFARNTGGPVAPRPPIGTTAAGFDPRVADVPTAFARLVEVGGRPLSPPAARPWGNEATYVADPDGNVVAVARPPAR